MIVPDINVLVYAFRDEAPEHDRYAEWLNTAVEREPVGVADVILSGFVRIVTHPRITSTPAPIVAAIEFTRGLVDAPNVQWLAGGVTSWSQLEALAAHDSGIRGNLVPDAYIAALCLANGARLATRDRGFARFPGLKHFDPGMA